MKFGIPPFAASDRQGHVRRYIPIGGVLLALFVLAGCETMQKVVLGGQRTFNGAVAGMNAYAAQPFCGSAGAPEPPACAKAELVIEMSDAATEAQEGLDVAREAVKDESLEDAQIEVIVTSAITTIGKFAGILAKNHIPQPVTE